jgi:hypothetical protein
MSQSTNNPRTTVNVCLMAQCDILLSAPLETCDPKVFDRYEEYLQYDLAAKASTRWAACMVAPDDRNDVRVVKGVNHNVIAVSSIPGICIDGNDLQVDGLDVSFSADEGRTHGAEAAALEYIYGVLPSLYAFVLGTYYSHVVDKTQIETDEELLELAERVRRLVAKGKVTPRFDPEATN